MNSARPKRQLVAEVSGRTFRIHEDNPDVGWYLYVEKNGRCVQDFLQATLEQTKQCALEEFSVPLGAWEEIDL